MGQQGFWDFESRHQKLESKKDLLVCLDEMMPREEFRPILDRVYIRPRKSNAGRHSITGIKTTSTEMQDMDLFVVMSSSMPMMGFESHINERAYRNRPLSEQQIVDNRERSKTRAKVEYVFGSIINKMGSKVFRIIGLARSTTMLGLKNLTYNLKRYVFWQKQDIAESTP